MTITIELYDEIYDKNIQRLILMETQITRICPKIGQLQNLRELNLGYNEITNVCPEIGQLQNLRELNLSFNQIMNVCPEIGQLQNLQELNLCNNEIIRIFPEIGQLQQLHELYLNGNQIKNLCSEIGQLQHLQELYLSNNQIKNVCPEIGQLQHLQTLDLSNNQIKNICHEIGQLQNLQILYLYYNQITMIPTNIRMDICMGYINNPDLSYLGILFGTPNKEHNIPCVQQFLNRKKYIGGIRINIYNDSESESENIHKLSIKTIKNSIFNLLNTYYEINTKNEMNNYIEDLVLTNKTKQLITKYISIKWINSHFGCAFEEIFKAIWNEICTLQIDSQNEVKNRLNEEIDNSECKCYTGCISRLVNCLSGYSNKVLMKLSDAELIGNIISLVRSKYIDSDIDTIKKIITDELIEYNFDQDVIEEWISYIVWIKSIELNK